MSSATAVTASNSTETVPVPAVPPSPGYWPASSPRSPDLHANVQDIFGHGDEVVVRLVVTGTQEGSLLGIPATGRQLQWDAIDLYRLKGGKISQEWASEDLTAILNDTGTYKAPWIP